MRIGMRGHDLPYTDAKSLMENCKRLGIETLQLALPKSFPDIPWQPGIFSPGLAAQIKREMDANGVQIPVLGCYIDPVRPDDAMRQADLDKFAEHMLFAKYLGADMIGTETGAYASFGTAETRSETAYQRLLDGFRPLVRRAEKLGVMIGVEAVTAHTLYCPQCMQRFLQDMDSPNLFVIFDPVNLIDCTNYRRQREMMDEVFSLYGNRVAVLHLKDFIIEEGNLRTCLAGDGMLDIPYLSGLIRAKKPGIDIILEEVTEHEWTRISAQVQTYFHD